MKKHGNRSSINRLKERLLEQSGNVEDLELFRDKESVKDYYYQEDESPSLEPIKASLVYKDYVYWCSLENIEACNINRFRELSSEYVEKRKAWEGCIWYTLQPRVYDYLNSLLESGEEVKKAA